MVSNTLLAENISRDDFDKLLDRYSPMIESISAGKPSKAGQETLTELDEFRYKTATGLFSPEGLNQAMDHGHVKTLVDWKLRHGKFRPTLMKLVSSNDPETVQETIKQAIAAYRKSTSSNSDTAATAAAVKAISALKGIGPATASLLLSVHDPERVIFFSDEAFWWLCCAGKTATPIKYNAKEYQDLIEAAQTLEQRLKVGATDVEKVAYVLAKEGGASLSSAGRSPTMSPATKSSAADANSRKVIEKRKEVSEKPNSTETSLRRSKRNKR